MEYSFGRTDAATQMKHPTMRSYCERKPWALTDMVNTCCNVFHSRHTSRHQTYATPEQSDVEAGELLREMRRIDARLHPPPCTDGMSAGELQKLQREEKAAEFMHRVAACQPTNNIRASNYKARCGYPPTILQGAEADATETHVPSITSLDKALESSRGDRQEAIRLLNETRDEEANILHRGDIVFCVAGQISFAEDPENFVDSNEAFWALQLTEPLPLSHNRTRCKVKGFWLDRGQWITIDDGEGGEQWVLLDQQEVAVYFGTLIKDESGRPFAVNSATLPSSQAQDDPGRRFRERLVYQLPPTLVDELETAVDVRERAEANVKDSQSEMPQQAEDELEAANEDNDENEEDEDSFLQGGVATGIDKEHTACVLAEQLQGRYAGVDMAPTSRPRRAKCPIDRLIYAQSGGAVER
uniref:Uncharacterized protein n=1 Tax=Calcidiscus leptoporus TaxID=127549 RepID=A0A7S0J041_9EUKA